ncbi:MAG: hypothetical protein KA715_12755 [Xanthomonadaceae bacterium]|nr:hypothetical protein [Xanthomonadaceae bacterium]
MTIHPVITDTDWDFFLEVHWRAQGTLPDFKPEIGPWIRTLGNELVSNELRKRNRISSWVLKRGCIPILRWVLWSETTSPDVVYVDALIGIKEELTPAAWNEYNHWLEKWKKSHGITKVVPQTLLPWFESNSNETAQTYSIKLDSPNLMSFRAKIEKSRLLSSIQFEKLDWNLLPKIYQPWAPWLRAVIDESLCFMAIQSGKPIGFIIGMPHYSQPGEPDSQELYRGRATLFWRIKAKIITALLSRKVKSGKIIWIAENKASEDLGVSVILMNEFLRRCYDRGMKRVETPLISKDQYILTAALKEIGATLT